RPCDRVRCLDSSTACQAPCAADRLIAGLAGRSRSTAGHGAGCPFAAGIRQSCAAGALPHPAAAALMHRLLFAALLLVPLSVPAAQRVVSLAPSLTEIMLELDAGELLVGMLDGGERPAALTDVQSVG